MEQNTSETCVLEQVLATLEDEKAQLEEKLETELEDSKREEIKTRIGVIWADLEIRTQERAATATNSS